MCHAITEGVFTVGLAKSAISVWWRCRNMTGDTDGGHDGQDRASNRPGPTDRPTTAPTETRPITDGGFEAGFFSAVVEKVGVGVGVYEENGRFTYVNQAYADLLGMDRDALHGTAVWDVNPTLDRMAFDDYWTSFEIGETRQRETLHVDGDGSELPVETHTTAIEVDGTTYHVGTIADISERVEGWSKLERQDERLEQFASVVSHDLRNPLNVAMGRLQLAQETTDAEHLDHVEESLDRIEALIGDVLTMARDGNRIKEPEPVEVGPVVRRAWRTVGVDDATLSIDAEFGTIESDEHRLLEVFENLLGNAVRHAGPDVTVTVGRTADTLYVTDDGPGIAEGDRERVLDYGYTTATDGTGFGLTIVEQIVTAHDWTLSLAESADGGLRVEIGGIDFE